MNSPPSIDDQLSALASHVAARRSAILRAWRTAVDDDPELTAPAALPRTQFNDHVPELLDTLERRLIAGARRESVASEERRKENSAGHGLQRWQQGYHLREVTREWGHLHLCLMDELEQFTATRSDLHPAVVATAARALAELCSQGVSESASRYFLLQQTEARGHVRDLELTLGMARDLERQRGELLRQAAHDLRGHVGVVRNATTGLTRDAAPDGAREAFMRLLQKSVSSLHAMLDDVMDLARLQAGHELRSVAAVDVGALLHDVAEHLQPMAAERGLYLTAQGPVPLVVDADATKLRRITMNLLLNALKYTTHGGVTVCWGDSRDNDAARWMLSVEDTGPGFHAGPGGPLAGALEDATNEARDVEIHAGGDADPARTDTHSSAPAPPADTRPVHQEGGEGIGLSIVKRLCELLDASMEMASTPEAGTTFRVVLPRQYPATVPSPGSTRSSS